jgi:transposase-like protein
MLDPRTELVPNLIRGHRKDGRCQYDKAAKRELVRRCLEPGVSLAGLALAHGLNANLLRKWVDVLGGRMRPRRTRALAGPVAALLPVKVAEPDPSGGVASADGYVEIILGGATIRAHGRIDAQLLRTVLDCMASRA